MEDSFYQMVFVSFRMTDLGEFINRRKVDFGNEGV